MNSERIKILADGVYYETLETTLRRFPQTLLGSRNKRRNLPKTHSNVINLHCNAVIFDAILFYYQSNGILTRPPSSSVTDFERMCRYFAISESDIRRMKRREGVILDDQEPAYEFVNCAQLKVWEFIENPQSSRFAGFYSTFVCLLIFTSVLVGCFQTIPKLGMNRIVQNFDNRLFLVDFASNAFFTVELLLRFVVTPSKVRFFASTVNIIDIIAILPYMIIQALSPTEHSTVAFLQAIRTFRVLRMLRIRRCSKRLQVVFRILADCVVDVFTMVLAVVMSSLAYASILYYVEQTEAVDTQFLSIPHSMWWAIQTIIPLGYGDIVPRSISGKIAGGMVCILAAFSFTVPVLFLGGKFLALYSKSFGMVLGNDFKGFDSDHKDY